MSDNSSEGPFVSFDIQSTPTPNEKGYRHPNCAMRLNPDGLPVAWRRAGGPSDGSFPSTQFQLVTPRGVSTVAAEVMERQKKACSPLN